MKFCIFFGLTGLMIIIKTNLKHIGLRNVNFILYETRIYIPTYFQTTLKVLKCHYMQMKFKSCFNMAGKNLLIFGKTPEIYSEHFLKSAVRNNKMKLKNFSSFSTPQGTQPNVW